MRLPLLAGVVITDDPKVAFKDVDAAFLVGARPRSKGMERADLLLANAEIFKVQGAALNEVAKRDVKVLVVGNPANTNAYITAKSAPDLPAGNITAMLRLDPQPRALAVRGQDRRQQRRHREAGGVGQSLPDHVRRLPLRHREGPAPAEARQ